MPRPVPAPRCGCCDRLEVLALCEVCQEPTCAAHLRRVGPVGAPSYCCAICLEAVREQAAAVDVALAEVSA